MLCSIFTPVSLIAGTQPLVPTVKREDSATEERIAQILSNAKQAMHGKKGKNMQVEPVPLQVHVSYNNNKTLAPPPPQQQQQPLHLAVRIVFQAVNIFMFLNIIRHLKLRCAMKTHLIKCNVWGV